MFCGSHPIVKSDTQEFYVRIVRKRSPYRDEAGSALIARLGLLEYYDIFSGFSCILHLEHHLASLSKVPLQIFRC